MSNDDKVFDVAKPGETEAQATSRPVITGHKVMLSDPMVKSDGEDNVDLTMPGKTKINISTDPEDRPSGSPKPVEVSTMSSIASTDTNDIKPIDPNLKLEENDDTKTEPRKEPPKLQINVNEKPTALAASEVKVNDSLPPETEPAKEDIGEKSETGDLPGGGEVIAKTNAQKKAEQETKKTEAYKKSMEDLAASKKYHVPIGQKTRKKRSVILVIVVAAILMLVVLLAYFMMK